MNIRQAKEEIKNTVQAYLKKEDDGTYQIPALRQRPMLLMGPPGIGKTQIMEQIARECQIGLVAYTITHHTRQSAVGLPFIVKEEFGGTTYSVTEYTMSEIIASVYRKMKETGLAEGILFIDEINCVSETLAPTMLQFLQCKTFGNQAVPEGWIIVAAGNPPAYNKSVRDFDMVTLDRVRRMDIEADFGIWKEYAREQGIHESILTYLELRPQNFYRVENDVDGMQFVTARGWEDLSNLMDAYENLNIPVTEDVIHEFLAHEEVARDVAAYVDLYKKYEDHYGIADILAGKVRTDVYTRLYQASFDERLSVVHLLLSGLNEHFRQVAAVKSVTDGWFAFLKQYRTRLTEEVGQETQANEREMQVGEATQAAGRGSEAVGQDTQEKDAAKKAHMLYEQMIQEEERSLEQAKTSGFLTREGERTRRLLLKKIREGMPDETAFRQTSGEVSGMFDTAREAFAAETSRLELAEEETAQALEHAFDFMEAAFAEGQEMVVFVTELTMGTDAAAYLAENACERYQKYNRELMLGTKKAELLSELRTGGIRAQEV